MHPRFHLSPFIHNHAIIYLTCLQKSFLPANWEPTNSRTGHSSSRAGIYGAEHISICHAMLSCNQIGVEQGSRINICMTLNSPERTRRMREPMCFQNFSFCFHSLLLAPVYLATDRHIHVSVTLSPTQPRPPPAIFHKAIYDNARRRKKSTIRSHKWALDS